MVTMELTARYFIEHVRKGFRDIFSEQRHIAAKKIYSHEYRTRQGYPRSRSHELEKALQGPDYRIRPEGSGISARVNYPTHIRFLDMKRLGNYRIYNRPIWGILYGETVSNIKYSYRQWLSELFGEEIENVYQPLKNLQL